MWSEKVIGRIVPALAEAMVPRGGGYEIGGSDVDVAGRILASAKMLRLTPRPLALYLAFFDWFPILLFYRFSRFSRMGALDRERFLERLAASRRFVIMGIFQTVKAIVMPAYYADEQVSAAIGYDGWEKEEAA